MTADFIPFGFQYYRAHTAAGDLFFVRRLIGEPDRFADAPAGLRCDLVTDEDSGFLVLENTTDGKKSVSVPAGMRVGTVYGRATVDREIVSVEVGQAAVVELIKR